jgi:hypothetical protein
MRPAYLFIGVLLCVLCIGVASAETYLFEGTTANGQYSATLVEGDDGSAALSLAAVSGGTMSPGSSGSLGDPAPVPTVNAMVSQDLTFDVQNGQGFAGCSVIGASGDQASTGTWISGTSANVSQEAGTFDTSWWENIALNGVYAGQEVLSPPVGAYTLPVSYGFVKSATWATSAKGDSALVEVNSTGPLMALQGATAGSVIAAFDPLYVGVDGAIAGQEGLTGIPPDGGNYQAAPGGNVDASGTATDAQGTTASTGTHVENGYLSFFQVVGAGTIDAAYDFLGIGPSEGILGANISGAFAVQDVYGDGSVSSESSASSATGHSASAGLITDGAFEFTQGALAGGLSAGYNTSGAGINCALAGQGGAFETSGTGLLTGTAGDSNGNSVSTETTLINGSADLFVQVVGSGNADMDLDLEDLFGIPGVGPQAGISGVFGGQYVDGDGSSVSSETRGTSAGGNSASARLRNDGPFEFGRGALAGALSASHNTSSVAVDYALAGQGGSFETCPDGHGIVSSRAADSNGNSVSTTTGVENGSLSFFVQVVGAGNADVNLDADLLGSSGDNPQVTGSGAFGVQAVNGETAGGELVSATSGFSAGQDLAFVFAGSSGNSTGQVAQVGVAGNVNVDTGCGEMDDILISGALAGQVGRFQNTTAVGSTSAGASGFGINSQGDDALVFSQAENGTLTFAQLALAGGVDAGETGNVTAALAMQVSNVTGTGGLVEARTSNTAGDESRVNVTFSNINNKVGYITSASAAGAGSVSSPYLVPVIGDDTISGTGAGLYELGRSGTLRDYNMTAYAHLEGSGSDFVYRTGKVNLHYAYAYTGLGDRDAKIGNH